MSETLPDPRKRPRQARSVATFEAILEAAARILESLGFAGFNTNAVAELAGVSIGSLYQYFPSKDALIVELIDVNALNFQIVSLKLYSNTTSQT